MFTIRRYTIDDFAAATRVWHDSAHDAFPYVATIQAHTLDDDRAFFQRNYADRADIFIGEVDGQVAGLLVLVDDCIEQLFVATWAQGRGIGAALLAAAKRERPGGLYLYAFQKNDGARRFYERHGFVATQFGISPEPECEPDVTYVWKGDLAAIGDSD